MLAGGLGGTVKLGDGGCADWFAGVGSGADGWGGNSSKPRNVVEVTVEPVRIRHCNPNGAQAREMAVLRAVGKKRVDNFLRRVTKCTTCKGRQRCFPNLGTLSAHGGRCCGCPAAVRSAADLQSRSRASSSARSKAFL